MGKLLWVKGGPSPNPSGKPKKGYGLAAILTTKGDLLLPDGRTQREAVIDRLYSIALTGGIRDTATIKAIEILLEREFGKPLDRVAFVQDEDEPPTLEELRTLVRLREEQKDDPSGDTAGDRPA